MINQEKLIKDTLISSKTIAMVGASSIKKEVLSNLNRRPSTIVMKYLQEFGYRVIPVNPFSIGKKIYGETIIGKLSDIDIPVDIVDVFRPAKETPIIAKEAVEIGAKVLWLQYGIENKEAEEIAKAANIVYIANRCIKQEYQKFFLKVNPVFPALKG